MLDTLLLLAALTDDPTIDLAPPVDCVTYEEAIAAARMMQATGFPLFSFTVLGKGEVTLVLMSPLLPTIQKQVFVGPCRVRVWEEPR